jgi:hypothetical protein
MDRAERSTSRGGYSGIAVTALGAFVATLALLAAVAPVPGGATALAEDPGDGADAGAVVQGFDPANPVDGVRPAAAAVGAVAVNAHFEARDGVREIVVDFENSGRRPADVACRVALARLTSVAVEPLARLVPSPEREELLSEALRVSLAPGERVSRRVTVPAGLAIAAVAAGQRAEAHSENQTEPVRASWTALSIEAHNGSN